MIEIIKSSVIFAFVNDPNPLKLEKMKLKSDFLKEYPNLGEDDYEDYLLGLKEFWGQSIRCEGVNSLGAALLEREFEIRNEIEEFKSAIFSKIDNLIKKRKEEERLKKISG